MFATLILEREFASFRDLGGMFQSWIQVFGIMAVVTMLLVELFRHLRARGSLLVHGMGGHLTATDERQVWRIRTLWLILILFGLGLVIGGFLLAIGWRDSANIAFTAACACAALAVCWEFFLDLFNLSGRRIWAIARLSIKEAFRRKALWSFVILLAIFLFWRWFMTASKPQDQWRQYVGLVFAVVTALLLITTSILACFSLPNDIRQQTIHTVVTKPVQRLEIILGRIIGFGLLMTAVLLVVAHLSLLYVFREIDAEARRATMRARVFLQGDLVFEDLDSQGRWAPRERGENVGREWDYRQYIRGGSTQEAVWRFKNLADVKGLDKIPVEFSFDIFRMSKGGDIPEQGVSCQFAFINTSKYDYASYSSMRDELDAESSLPLAPEERAKRTGYYELPTPIQVYDYQTQEVRFPASVLEGLTENGELQVRVSCRSNGQYLGMAKHDLYVRAKEGSFYFNYMKGILGIWFLMMLMLCLGVVFSTYLSALVSLLLSWTLLFCGIPRVRGFVQLLGSAADPMTNPGGGPLESAYRLARNENMITPLERSRGVWMMEQTDDLFRWGFRRVLNVLPDLYQYNRSVYVAEGFNIAGSELLVSCILLAGYLFPFLLLGYYLLNSREIAQAT